MDISARIFKYKTIIYWIIIHRLSAFIMRPLLWLKGITLGRNTIFGGLTLFSRYPDSIIEIGDYANFKSTSGSNLIGINRKCIISTNLARAHLKIGDNCGFSGTVIGVFKSVVLGDNVRCGANTLITDSDWHLDDPRAGEVKPIRIGDNVWLGVNSVVLKGVTIGENTVIGANSVVVKNIPANVIAAGNPCKVIKEINAE
jgi:acetyltransferase-like isoleucine patch superfamily enzyme